MRSTLRYTQPTAPPGEGQRAALDAQSVHEKTVARPGEQTAAQRPGTKSQTRPDNRATGIGLSNTCGAETARPQAPEGERKKESSGTQATRGERQSKSCWVVCCFRCVGRRPTLTWCGYQRRTCKVLEIISMVCSPLTIARNAMRNVHAKLLIRRSDSAFAFVVLPYSPKPLVRRRG